MTYKNPERVIRGGGSWYYVAQPARAALRGRWRPGSRDGGLGFRLVSKT